MEEIVFVNAFILYLTSHAKHSKNPGCHSILIKIIWTHTRHLHFPITLYISHIDTYLYRCIRLYSGRKILTLIQDDKKDLSVQKMYFTYLQGRVPAWNLAGLLPPDPTSPGPGGPSPGVSSAAGGLPHPLPHYSGAYGGQHHSHYPHILQPQSSADIPHHPWPPNMETGNSESASLSASAAMHYKMDPDASAVMSMYYNPHQVGKNVQIFWDHPKILYFRVLEARPQQVQSLLHQQPRLWPQQLQVRRKRYKFQIFRSQLRLRPQQSNLRIFCILI